MLAYNFAIDRPAHYRMRPLETEHVEAVRRRRLGIKSHGRRCFFVRQMHVGGELLAVRADYLEDVYLGRPAPVVRQEPQCQMLALTDRADAGADLPITIKLPGGQGGADHR